MGMSGDLSSVNLADVFQMLSMGQEQQVLTVTDGGDSTKHFTFSQNSISVVLNTKKLGPMGQLLVNLGKITEDQLNQSLIAQQTQGGRVGEVIIRLGFATQHDVEGVFRMQMEEEIYEVLDWHAGSFMVQNPEEVDMSGGSEVELTFDVVSILMESARRIDEWKTLRQNLPSMDDIYVKTQELRINPNDTAVPPLYRTLAKHIDGTYTLQELTHKLMLPRFEVLSAMNQLLAENKLARLAGNDLVRVAEAHFNLGKLDTGFRILERASELDPNNIELIERVANAYAQAGKQKDSSRHYQALAERLMETGDAANALSYAQKAIKVDRYNVAMRMMVFDHSLETKKTVEAINSARYLVVHHSDHQEWDEAITVCNRILEVQVENVEFRAKLIDIFLNSNDINSALSHCEVLEQHLSKDNMQMIKVYKKVLARFPGHEYAQERITNLTRRYRKQIINNYSLLSAIVASAVAGILFTIKFYDKLDEWLHF